MSEMLVSILIALGILAALAAVVPMLHVCNAGCQRLFGRRRTAERMEKSEPSRPTVKLGEVAPSDRRSLSKVTLFS